MNGFAVEPTYARVDPHERRNDLENIVLQDRTSIVLIVVGEDAAYVVGYYGDIRGMPVDTQLRRVDKTAIALRIQVSKYLKGNPDTLTYSHRKEDRS